MRAPSLLLVLATAGLAAACGGKPAPEQPAPEADAGPDARAGARPVDDSAERDGVEKRAAAREAAERAKAVAADLAAMINFEYDQATVRSADQGTLDRKAAILGANPNVKVQISGHADERGSDEYNLALGNRRAAAAKRYLENKGIDAVAHGRRLLRRGAAAQPGPRRGGLRPEPPRRVPGHGGRRQPRRAAVSSRDGRLTAALPRPLVVAAGLAGCVSKGDVQLVQGEVALLRAETLRRDSTRAAQLAEVIQMQRQIMDSLTATRRAVGQLKGDIASDLYNIQQQLVQLQELTGQSQQRLSELRTQLEARGAQIETTPRRPGRATPGDTAQPHRRAVRLGRRDVRGLAGAAPARQHGHRAARASARCSAPIRPARGRPTRSTSSARASRRRTRTRPRRTTRRWSTSTRPPPAPRSALYNLGLLAERRKDTAKAKDAYQRVVQKYPQSDEAALARDRLKALGR